MILLLLLNKLFNCHLNDMENLLVKSIKQSEESTGPATEDLQNKLCKILLNQLQKDVYQSASEDVLKIHENSFRPSEMKLQGSAADGFLLHGYIIKSDIDFLYSMDIFNPSLKFEKLISNPNSPAHVKIEVIPNFSECKTDIEKEKLMTNIEQKDGQYFLNIEHIKHVIYDQIGKRLENSSKYQSVIKSEKNSCFRIQFEYEFSQVIRNHVIDQTVHLVEFSESILKTTEFKENVKKLFYNLSGNYFVSQYKWKKFKEKFNFFTEKNLSSSYYSINNSLKNKTLHQEIFKDFNFYFDEINDELNKMLELNCLHWRCFNIIEDCFYLLLLILFNCGLDTIVEVISDKIIFVENQNIELVEKLYYCDTVYFTEEEITKIINIDLSYILNEPITQEEKDIEQIFHNFLVKNANEIKKKIAERKMPPYLDKVEDLNDRIPRNKLDWISSMIKLLVQFLESYKYWWTTPPSVSHSLIQDQTIEIIPGLDFNDWPLIASDWVTRKRYWPESELTQRIVNNCFHVVFKSLNENTGYDGRLSFSEAETFMCHAMTQDQMVVYNFIKHHLRVTCSKKLKSYYIKTLCFWVFELIPIDNLKNMQNKYLQDIIKKLCMALKERTLQHYFLPKHNLFIELKNEDFDEIINCLLKIDSEKYERRLRLMEKRHDINISHFFKLIENVFFKSINEIFKNIIPELIK